MPNTDDDDMTARDRIVIARALRKQASFFEYEMSKVWGGDATWISTGNRVADLVADVLRENAAEIEDGGGE